MVEVVALDILLGLEVQEEQPCSCTRKRLYLMVLSMSMEAMGGEEQILQSKFLHHSFLYDLFPH